MVSIQFIILSIVHIVQYTLAKSIALIVFHYFLAAVSLSLSLSFHRISTWMYEFNSKQSFYSIIKFGWVCIELAASWFSYFVLVVVVLFKPKSHRLVWLTLFSNFKILTAKLLLILHTATAWDSSFLLRIKHGFWLMCSYFFCWSSFIL